MIKWLIKIQEGWNLNYVIWYNNNELEIYYVFGVWYVLVGIDELAKVLGALSMSLVIKKECEVIESKGTYSKNLKLSNILSFSFISPSSQYPSPC